MKCPHCDVSLSEHKGGRLICHYCGYTQPMPKLCPKCGSKYILGFKAGTQQIEEKLKELYPGVRTLRMDADTTRTKDSYEKILSSFANGEADVLIGTQMIVKGHDFPKVTLVGILAADLSLNASDYRAGERTFQLLTQAVGRAGRGVLPGEAVIQTYQPDHYAITCAAAQDYESFYQEEILYRELSGYPPVAHMLAVQIYGKEEENVKQLALRLTDVVKSNMDFLSGKQKEQSNKKIQVLGPAPANISKINDIYRYAIRNIREYGDEVLTKTCKEVKEMTPRTKELIEDMLETMYDANGVGLAAPQVGVLKRIVVIDTTGEDPYILINPRIVESSGEQTGQEGCLSVPGKFGIVTRPNYVKAVALDVNMKPIEVEGTELLARAICHELDHLDGHLYVEKAEGPLQDMTYEDEEEE